MSRTREPEDRRVPAVRDAAGERSCGTGGAPDGENPSCGAAERTNPLAGRRRIDFANGGWLCVEPLRPEEETLGAVTEEDRALAAQFSSARRRREFLSWRAMLYRELGHSATIRYNAAGAPCPVGLPGGIGVSHSRTQAAVCWSPDAPCAVDLEAPGRNFAAIADRYLTEEEAALDDRPEWPCIAWCAKECLYKLSGRRGLDLRNDLRISAIDFPAGEQEGQLRGSAAEAVHTLRFARLGDDWAVWKE